MADIDIKAGKAGDPGAVKASAQSSAPDEALAQFVNDYSRSGPQGTYELYGDEALPLYDAAKLQGLIPKEIDRGPPAPPDQDSMAQALYGAKG